MLTTPAFLPAAPPLLLEEVGERTADAAVAAARAWYESRHGGLTIETKMHGADQLVRLFELWQVCADGRTDFYAVARARGARLLQKRYGRDISTRMIAVLIGGVLEALQQICRAELN
jgi:hypothetical protein